MVPEIVAELDRQLSEQRATAESLSTRSGLIIAASAALIGFAAVTKTPPSSPWGYWFLGFATVLGLTVFWASRVGIGPTLSVVVFRNDSDLLADAKLLLVDANRTVLTRAQVFFTAQVIFTIAGVVSLALALWPVR